MAAIVGRRGTPALAGCCDSAVAADRNRSGGGAATRDYRFFRVPLGSTLPMADFWSLTSTFSATSSVT